ncbi:MAG: ATP-binding protein [Gammaproteobacteria bacterium]|nr:ATP-binding protein [Gammaproteobacteria bacterium]
MSKTDLSPAQLNASTLELEIDWFNRVLEAVVQLYFEQEGGPEDIRQITPPDLGPDDSEYARLVRQHAMDFDERIVLVLAMIPHVRPQMLDLLFIRNKNLDRGYTEFGGWQGKYHGGFLPTGETAAFFLAGQDLARRFALSRLFQADHFFARSAILRIQRETEDEPFLSGALIVSADLLSRCTSGLSHKPDYSISFPAKLISTRLGWDDLVLAPQVLAEIDIIKTWMRHSTTIMHDWGLEKTIKPGYRSLFYGPPGTGKTLTATLIGDELGVDVYRIDLSMVVSKYIGETEKNLANVFDQAQHKNWILFFDEADALFGKRTQTISSNDRYANQEVSYLLQRVEDYPGIVILATNLKDNIDEAFARRFQSMVYFPLPDVALRRKLWQNTLNGRADLADGVDLKQLASEYELSGGAITNVVRYGAISALQMNRDSINREDLVKGVTKELRKEGKTI